MSTWSERAKEWYPHAIATLSFVVAVLAWLSVTSDELDFQGLAIQADLDEQAQPRLYLPSGIERQPLEVMLRGSIIDASSPGKPPIIFEVPLSLVSVDGSILTYEDFRPVVCDALQHDQACESLNVGAMVLRAEFARGPKTVEIDESRYFNLF